jgi:hypothetical protein
MLLSSKRFRTAIASLVLMAGIASAAPAMADDGISLLDGHEDSNFTFNLTVSSTTAGTSGQQKNETSPLLIYPTTITCDQCRVYGEGSTARTGSWASGSSLTIGGYGTIYSGDKKTRLLLKTNIKEYGYSYARLTAWKSSGEGKVSGVWSPDSYSQSGDIIINAGYR